MKKFLKDMYGVGILFFYYMKWLIVIGLPLLYFGLDYTSNTIMNILWGFSMLLIIKDIIYLIILRKKY
jgi:hypothetical protein